MSLYYRPNYRTTPFTVVVFSSDSSASLEIGHSGHELEYHGDDYFDRLNDHIYDDASSLMVELS